MRVCEGSGRGGESEGGMRVLNGEKKRTLGQTVELLFEPYF